MLTTLVIGPTATATAYSSSGVAYSGFAGSGGTKSWGSARIFGLKLTLADEDYSTADFVVAGCGPAMPLLPGLPLVVVTSADDGSSPVVRLTGRLQAGEVSESDIGWAFCYRSYDLKREADYVPVSASDGSGVASYNLPPDDELALFYLSGLTTGQIVADVLQGSTVAAGLMALGVGGYTLTSGVYTLNATTLGDLAALSNVPRQAVQLQGDSVLNTLEAFIQSWHAQYTLWVQGDGVIRVTPIFGRTSHSLTVPGGGVAGDPLEWPSYTAPDISNCYTAVRIVGLDIQAAELSQVAGTLSKAWTGPNEAAWTSADALAPKGSVDYGTASSVTSVNCVVHSDQATVSWVTNFWNNGGGTIVLFNPAGTGILQWETKQVTSCTALTAGGTATIGWDSSDPVDSTSYTRYTLMGNKTDLSLVGEEFHVRNPADGSLDRATYVGNHLYPRFPRGTWWGNNSQKVQVFYPAAKVLWSPTGAYPWFEMPIPVRVNPATGRIRLTKPAVFVSAALAGQTAALANGYPTTYFGGLYYDVRVIVPYNRGLISARSPASGFSGTAYTKYGIQREKPIHMDSFTWKGDAPDLVNLASEILAVLQNAVVEGSDVMHWDAWTPTFDVLAVGYSLRLNLPGGVSELDGLDLPVRSVTMEWPHEGADIHRVTFNFSTRRRPFEGDSLWTHPAFAPPALGTQDGSVFVAGDVGGMSGSMDAGSFGQASMDHAESAGASHGDGWGSPSLGQGADQGWADGGPNAHQPDPTDLGPIATNGDPRTLDGDASTLNGDPFGQVEGFRSGMEGRGQRRQAREEQANRFTPPPGTAGQIFGEPGKADPAPPQSEARAGRPKSLRDLRNPDDDQTGGG